MPLPMPEPERVRRFRHSFLVALACIAAIAGALAWQACVVPALTHRLQVPLGAGTTLALAVVFALVGGLALYWLVNALAASRAGASACDADPARLWTDCTQQLLALAHALPIGMLLLRDGRIVNANPGALQQLQLDTAQLPALSPATLFTDPVVAVQVLEGALMPLTGVQLQRRNGETFRTRMSAHQLTLGQHHFRVLLFDDLSESERLDARLQQRNEQLLAVTGRLMTAQEDERRTLSRELHDDIGQSITAIKLGAVAMSHDDAPRQEIIDEIVAIADQTIAKLRNLSMLLRPPQLDELGLEAAVRWQAQTLFRSDQPRLQLAFTPLPQRPPPAVELACFRIVQEALTNVLRYADATQVEVTLEPDGDLLALTVSDNGRGFVLGSGNGLGLITMRERAQQLGGQFQIETAPGAGTQVLAKLPMALPAPRES